MMSIRRIMMGAGTLCGAMLVLLLALLIGDGRPLAGWVVWYLGALAAVNLLGLWARIGWR